MVDPSLPPALRGIRRTNHRCSIKPCHNLLNPGVPFKMCETHRQKDQESRKRKAQKKEKKKIAGAEDEQDDASQQRSLAGAEKAAIPHAGARHATASGSDTAEVSSSSQNRPIYEEEDEATVSRALMSSGNETASNTSSVMSTTCAPEGSSASHKQPTRIIFMDPLVPPSFASSSHPTFQQDSSVSFPNSTTPSKSPPQPSVCSDPREAPFATISPSVTIRTAFVPKPTTFTHSAPASIDPARTDEAAFRAATEATAAEAAARATASLARVLPRISLDHGSTPGHSTAVYASASTPPVNDIPCSALPSVLPPTSSTVASESVANSRLNAMSLVTLTSPTVLHYDQAAAGSPTSSTPASATDATILPAKVVKKRKKASKPAQTAQSISSTGTKAKPTIDQKSCPPQLSSNKPTSSPQMPAPSPPGYSGYYIPAPYGTLPYYGHPPPHGMYPAHLMPYPFAPTLSEASPFASAPLPFYGEFMSSPPGGYGAMQSGMTAYMYAPGGGWHPYGYPMHPTTPYNGLPPSGVAEDMHHSESTKTVDGGKVRRIPLPTLLSKTVLIFGIY